MKSTETNILIVPGHGGAAEGHWQRRVEAKLTTANILPHDDWSYSSLPRAVAAMQAAIDASDLPVVFLAHSVGCQLVTHAIPELVKSGAGGKLKGAYLVVPPSPAAVKVMPGIDPALAEPLRDPLPFPSLLIASSNDPHATMEESADLSLAWGAQLVEAGEAGHINKESGHGPWPEGMMRFAGFLSKL
jgi:uncharacterized protein